MCVDLPASRSQKFQSTGGAPWQVYKSEQFFEAASGFELSLFLCPNILMEGAAAPAEEGPLASFPVNPDIVAPEPAAAPSASKTLPQKDFPEKTVDNNSQKRSQPIFATPIAP